MLIKSTTHPLLNPDSLLSSRSNSAHPTISLFTALMFIIRNQVSQFDFLITQLYYQTAHFRDGAVKVSFFFLQLDLNFSIQEFQSTLTKFTLSPRSLYSTV